jgi:hypothetical protein
MRSLHESNERIEERKQQESREPPKPEHSATFHDMSSPNITLKSFLQSGLLPVKKQNINLISSPHVKTNHKPASVLPSRVKWPVDLPTPSYHGTVDISSVMLDLVRSNKTELNYSTEADVRYMVSQLMGDWATHSR